MIRKEVMRLARALAEKSGLDADSIYAWLMWTGRDKGIHPKRLELCAGEGIVFVAGERDTTYIERVTAAPQRSRYTEDGPDWEGAILARQEPYMD